mmetsp:Transcript_40445/g.101588  ORF Transcript_40445/g.101588 Transcript_40445/m.101588 type:complete len:199 (+) Transcript_40445:87-683(+)
MTLPPMSCGGLRPTKCVTSDGSGRDSYVTMSDELRRGKAEGRTAWFNNLREPPKALSSHSKGLDAWYHPTRRPGHWSPPAPLPPSGGGEDGELSGASHRALGRMSRHAVSSLRRRAAQPAADSSTLLAFGGDSDSAATPSVPRRGEVRSASVPAAARRVAWEPSPPEGTPAEAVLGRMLLRTVSSFRLRSQRSRSPAG